MSDADALRLMREQDKLSRMKLARLCHELDKGEADLAAGCFVNIDSDDELHDLFRAL